MLIDFFPKEFLFFKFSYLFSGTDQGGQGVQLNMGPDLSWGAKLAKK